MMLAQKPIDRVEQLGGVGLMGQHVAGVLALHELDAWSPNAIAE